MVKSKVCVVTFFMLSVFTPKPNQLSLPFAVNQLVMYIKSLTVCIIATDISSVIATSLVVDDEFGRISGDPLETSSLAYSMDGEEDWIWGGEGPGLVDVQEIRAQLAFRGSLQALREIRSV